MNYLIEPFRHTTSTLRQHPWKAALVLGLQAAFLLAFFSIVFYYISTIFESATILLESFPEDAVGQSSITPELTTVYESYITLQRSILGLSVWLLLTIFSLQARIWMSVYSLFFPVHGFRAVLKTMAKQWVLYAVGTALVLALGVAITYASVSMTLNAGLSSTAKISILILAILGGLLYLVFLGIIPFLRIRNSVQISAFLLRNLHRLLGALLIIGILIGSTAYALYQSLEHGQRILAGLSAIVFLAALVFYKVYWVSLLYSLMPKAITRTETHHHEAKT